MQFGEISDIGRVRKINEDSCAVYTEGKFPYTVVADGMGGHSAGEVASRMAVDVIQKYLQENLMPQMSYSDAAETVRRSFIEANSAIYNYSKNNYKVMGMGTTTTLAMIYKNKLITAHVGDSRAYKIGKGAISQVTKDHSYVQELVRRGELTPEAAKTHPKRNFITRAMGVEDVVKIDVSITAYKGETILLCSDGLTSYVEDETILEYINRGESLQKSLEELAGLANDRGGRDNITITALKKG